MLSFEEARLRLLSGVAALAPERVPLVSAAGRVLAEDLRSAGPLPPFDASAMDGYAVHTGSFAGEGPWELPLAGESRAGAEAVPLAVDSAARILTGAPVPPGADAVVMQEK